MRTGRKAAAAATLALLTLSSCGGGSSGTPNGGSLTFRPLWEQSSASDGGVAAVSDAVGETTRGIFGSTLPAAVQTVRVILQSDSGQSCCLGVNPDALPTDAISGQRVLLLSQLPAGGATLTIAGFATTSAPTQGNISDACETDSANGVEPCDPTNVATPSFTSDPQRVTILGGVETNAGDIAAFAVPFVVSTSPAAGDAALNPVTVRFTVADGGAGINQQSIVVGVSQNDVPVADAAISAIACNDASAVRCSGGTLGVRGFVVTRAAQSLGIGPATVRIQAANLTGRTLDFSYLLQVVSAPVPTPTVPGGVRIVRPGAGGILEAVRSLPSGGTVIIAPGVYPRLSLVSSDVRGPLTLVGDVSGTLTESPPAAVVLNGGSVGPALQLSSVSDVTVDGLTCLGGSGAGVLVQRSTRSVIRNGVVSGPVGDGIRIENSQSGLVFDNLVANPRGTGIRVLGTDDLQIINNTVYNSTDSGLVVDSGDTPSDGITVHDNIFDGNRPVGIMVATSTGRYDTDFNINTDAYAAGTPIGPNDLTGAISNPLFNFPTSIDGFHLSAGSPAINAGDPNPVPDLASILAQRTTQTDGSLDIGRIDLGYHYPQVVTPTPTR